MKINVQNISRVVILFLTFLLESSVAYQSGIQAGGALCPLGQCCSIFGWCGTLGTYYHRRYCQSQCLAYSNSALPPLPLISSNISRIITPSLFEEMLSNRHDPSCPARGFYTYEAFIAATRHFPSFGATGSIETRKREIAAFFAQTSHATTGKGSPILIEKDIVMTSVEGWNGAAGGKQSRGYCFNKELSRSDCCVPSQEWPRTPGKQYYGRGPFLLTYNHNYGLAGKALGYDLLSDMDLVTTNATVSFETALWFWMTPQDLKPSCHDVIMGSWQPNFSNEIHKRERYSGFGSTTNVINGLNECGRGSRDDRVTDRIGFFERYCRLLDVSTGDNLDCDNSMPFDNIWSSKSQI